MKLYGIKEELENHLSIRTNELFDIQDSVVLYDLTNTYFEGEKRNSRLAKHGRSKEKRSDAKLVVLALVVNIFGFVKFASIHEGNFSDTSDIASVLDELASSGQSSPSMVIIDAGIATEANLKTIRDKGFNYLCVSRKKPTEYTYDPSSVTHHHYYREGKQVALRRVQCAGYADYFLEVRSDARLAKEEAMKSRFESRREQELEKVKSALSRKGGIKRLDKVHQRLGRLAEKYPSAYRYYDIDIQENREDNVAVDIKWEKNPEKYARKQRQLGTYYLRSNIDIGKESEVWDFLPYHPGSRDHVPDPEDRPRSSTDISQERSIYHFPSSFGAAGLLVSQHATM